MLALQEEEYACCCTAEPPRHGSFPEADVRQDGEDQDGDPAGHRVPDLQLRVRRQQQPTRDAPLCYPSQGHQQDPRAVCQEKHSGEHG